MFVALGKTTIKNLRILFCSIVLTGVGGCGENSANDSSGKRADYGTSAGGSVTNEGYPMRPSGPTVNPNTGGAKAGGGSVLPAETEQVLDFLTPEAGGRYVYVANPMRDSVAIIDSLTLAITEVTPGDAPTYLATVPGKDIALVDQIKKGYLRLPLVSSRAGWFFQTMAKPHS